MMKVSEELQEKYEHHYQDNNELWRQLGAKGKVDNIREITKGMQFSKVIEVGAGAGVVLSLLSEHQFAEALSAAEISSTAIETIKSKQIPNLVEAKQFDGYTLPFDDNQFDLAICTHVIEHVEHPRILLREIKRISKMQLFEVPIDFSFKVDQKFAQFNAYGHINIYTPALFNFLLLSEGFSILKKKNGLYKKEIVDFQHKRISLQYWLIMFKRMVWQLFPFLMKIKPNTYTVLTE